MIRDGYSLVDLATKKETQHFPSNVAPPDYIRISATAAVHSPEVGGVFENHTLVERYAQAAPAETRTKKLSAVAVDYDGTKAVASQALVNRSADELAAYDAATEVGRLAMTCTPRQMRLALLQVGDLDVVEAVVAAAGQDVRIQWEYSTLFERSHPAWNALVGGIGKTPTDVDALFALARTL